MNLDQIAYALKEIEAARVEFAELVERIETNSEQIRRDRMRHSALGRRVAALRAELEAHLAGKEAA